MHNFIDIDIQLSIKNSILIILIDIFVEISIIEIFT